MISIVVTCYNLGSYLLESIDSIFESIDGNGCEVILVNDGSDDLETINVINRIASDYPDLILINQKNQGLAKARNNGISVSRFDWIISFDADNIMLPEMIMTSFHLINSKKDIDIIYGNALFFGLKNKIWPNYGYDFEKLLIDNYIDACACFRKELFFSLNGYDHKMPKMGFEDWDFWLRASVRGYKFHFEPKLFFKYRVRDNSMLETAWPHKKTLIEYIFNKPELVHLKGYRDLIMFRDSNAFEITGRQLLSKILVRIKNRVLGRK